MMKMAYATTDSVSDLLKDAKQAPVFIQGTDDLAGVLLSVETYELMGRFDEAVFAYSDEEPNVQSNDADLIEPN